MGELLKYTDSLSNYPKSDDEDFYRGSYYLYHKNWYDGMPAQGKNQMPYYNYVGTFCFPNARNLFVYKDIKKINLRVLLHSEGHAPTLTTGS